MKNRVEKEQIFISEPAYIEEGAIIGYKPARAIKELKLIIGTNAYIRSGTIIYAGSTIGSNLETGHNCIIREECHIGNNLKIWSNSIIDYGCVIGNNVHIHCLVYVCQYSVIEDDVFLAPGVKLANDKYPVQKNNLKGPKILKGARIGMNATILPGIIIGEWALVGAGSVVTKNVPPHSIVLGNPATIYRKN